MKLRLLLLSLPLLTTACKKSEDTAAPAAKPVEAVAPKVEAADPKLAAGERLVEPSTGRVASLRWDVPDGSVTLAAIARGEDVVVRAFTKTGTTDVTTIAAGDLGTGLRVIAKGRAVLLMDESRVGHVPEVGAILAYEATRIEWDASAKKPVVTKTWTCDESESKNGTCERPDWAE